MDEFLDDLLPKLNDTLKAFYFFKLTSIFAFNVINCLTPAKLF